MVFHCGAVLDQDLFNALHASEEVLRATTKEASGFSHKFERAKLVKAWHLEEVSIRDEAGDRRGRSGSPTEKLFLIDWVQQELGCDDTCMPSPRSGRTLKLSKKSFVIDVSNLSLLRTWSPRQRMQSKGCKHRKFHREGMGLHVHSTDVHIRS